MNQTAQDQLREALLRRGNIERIQAALTAGADLNQPDHHGHTPLMNAVMGGVIESLECLLQAGADINPPDEKQNPLALARRLRSPKVAEFLISKGARCEIHPEPGPAEKELRLAARTGKMPLLEKALAAGANVNFRFDGEVTALFEAVFNGHIEVAEALLAAGASADFVDERGINLIQLALWKARDEPHHRRMRTAMKKLVPHIFEAKRT